MKDETRRQGNLWFNPKGGRPRKNQTADGARGGLSENVFPDDTKAVPSQRQKYPFLYGSSLDQQVAIESPTSNLSSKPDEKDDNQVEWFKATPDELQKRNLKDPLVFIEWKPMRSRFGYILSEYIFLRDLFSELEKKLRTKAFLPGVSCGEIIAIGRMKKSKREIGLLYKIKVHERVAVIPAAFLDGRRSSKKTRLSSKEEEGEE